LIWGGGVTVVLKQKRSKSWDPSQEKFKWKERLWAKEGVSVKGGAGESMNEIRGLVTHQNLKKGLWLCKKEGRW